MDRRRDKNLIVEPNAAMPGRKEVVEKDCTEIGFTEKSKAAAREKVRERKNLI